MRRREWVLNLSALAVPMAAVVAIAVAGGDAGSWLYLVAAMLVVGALAMIGGIAVVVAVRTVEPAVGACRRSGGPSARSCAWNRRP
jgi:hypothetical protein